MTRYQRHNDKSVNATTAVGSSGRGLKIKRLSSQKRFLFAQSAEHNVECSHRNLSCLPTLGQSSRGSGNLCFVCSFMVRAKDKNLHIAYRTSVLPGIESKSVIAGC